MGVMKLLQLSLLFPFWAEICIIPVCWHLAPCIWCFTFTSVRHKLGGFSGCLPKSCWRHKCQGAGCWAQGYPVDCSFGARAPPGAVAHLQGGHRDVLEGRALKLSLPCVQCTLDQESSLCFQSSQILAAQTDVPPGRGKREPLVMVSS